MEPVPSNKDARKVVIDWINHVLERRKWSGTDLARRSNLAPSTVLRMLNDPHHRFLPSLKTLEKISEGSGYPIPMAVIEALGGSRFGELRDGAPGAPAPSEVLRPETLPRQLTLDLRYFSALPKSLHTQVQHTVRVPSPPQFEGDDSAFAFYVPDAGLQPWIKAGALMFATKRRDPIAGDIVLVTDQEGRSGVRLLNHLDENGLALSRAYPEKTDETLTYDEVFEIAIVAAAIFL